MNNTLIVQRSTFTDNKLIEVATDSPSEVLNFLEAQVHACACCPCDDFEVTVDGVLIASGTPSECSVEFMQVTKGIWF